MNVELGQLGFYLKKSTVEITLQKRIEFTEYPTVMIVVVYRTKEKCDLANNRLTSLVLGHWRRLLHLLLHCISSARKDTDSVKG